MDAPFLGFCRHLLLPVGPGTHGRPASGTFLSGRGPCWCPLRSLFFTLHAFCPRPRFFFFFSQTCLSQEKVSVNFSRLPHPLVRIFEPALPFKPSMLEKDSNSQLQLQVSRWSWIANEAPQLATRKFTLCSHFLTLRTPKISRNGCFVATCTTQTHALTRDCSGTM